IRSPSSVRSAPRSFVSLNQSMVPRIRVAAALAKAIHDSTTCQVVGRQLDPNTIAGDQTNSIPLHPSAEIAERFVSVVELNSERASGEGLSHVPFELDLLFSLTHSPPFSLEA